MQFESPILEFQPNKRKKNSPAGLKWPIFQNGPGGVLGGLILLMDPAKGHDNKKNHIKSAHGVPKYVNVHNIF